MAIQISGTTVINDSRALTNIASVDETTVAAFGAAGVGGGVELSYTALGTITKGKIVTINKNGQGALGSLPVATDRITATCGMFIEGGRGTAVYLANENVYAIGGFTASGSRQIRFMRINPDNTVVLGNIFGVGSSAPSNGYGQFFKFAADGQGNYACAFGGYNGSVHPTYIKTFNLNSSLNVTNASGNTQLEYDGYYDRSDMAAYGTNKFMYIYHEGTNTNYGLKYRTFSKSGSSHTTHVDTSFMTVSGKAAVSNLIGREGPNVSDGQLVCTGAGDSTFLNNAGFSGVSGTQQFACTINMSGDTISSITSKVLGTTVVASAVDPSNDHNAFKHYPMTTSGFIYASHSNNSTQSTAAIWKKASLASDTITYVRSFDMSDNFGVDPENNLEIWPTNSTSLTFKDIASGAAVSTAAIPVATTGSFDEDWGEGSATTYWVYNNVLFNMTRPYGQDGNYHRKTLNLGNMSGGLVGIATENASAGQTFELAALGTLVDGFSNLGIGAGYGLGVTADGVLEEGVKPTIAVATSSTELLAITNTA
jgi:hypothetical protein